MPRQLTEITEVVTALGMLTPSLDAALATRPPELIGVNDAVWDQLCYVYREGHHKSSFQTAFDNGQAFLNSADGLRGRAPLRAEWKGPHRPPGDDVIPADLRVDHVFLISCKYLSKVLLNPGPPRLFDNLLVGEGRTAVHWFLETAPTEFQELYAATLKYTGIVGFPTGVADLTRPQQLQLKDALRARLWPEQLRPQWTDLCRAVAVASTQRWRTAMLSERDQLRLLWRMLRITTATYFILGADGTSQLRLRIDSAWDWMQSFELGSFKVEERNARQPEVGWTAEIRRRSDSQLLKVEGHVEIRWSHGRFLGSPEAKVYLDTPHLEVPGYNPL